MLFGGAAAVGGGPYMAVGGAGYLYIPPGPVVAAYTAPTGAETKSNINLYLQPIENT